jgi:hypothetical protein
VPMAEEPIGRFGATSDRLQIGLCATPATSHPTSAPLLTSHAPPSGALACKNTPGCEVFSFGKSEADQGKCLWSKGCIHSWSSEETYNSGVPLDAGGLFQYPPYVHRDESWDIYQVSRGANFPSVTDATDCSGWSCDRPDQFCPHDATGSSQDWGEAARAANGYSGFCCLASYRTAPPSSTACARTDGHVRGGHCGLKMCASPGDRPAGQNYQPGYPGYCREWDAKWAPAKWAPGAILGLCGARDSWMLPYIRSCPGSSCGNGGSGEGGGHEGQNCITQHNVWICRHRVWVRVRRL